MMHPRRTLAWMVILLGLVLAAASLTACDALERINAPHDPPKRCAYDTTYTTLWRDSTGKVVDSSVTTLRFDWCRR